MGLGKILGLSAVTGGGFAYVSSQHPEIIEATGDVLGKVQALVDGVYNTAIESAKNIPYFGSAAPFAFPMIAGASLGYKLGNYKIGQKLGLDTKIGRGVSIVAGAGVGYIANNSILAPYLAAYGLYKTGKLIYDKKLVQRLFKGVFNLTTNLATNTVRTVVEPVVSGYQGVKYDSLIKPNTGLSYANNVAYKAKAA